ncbi:uncharacterized protein BO97DRAFT_423478 [Aspergillus homomorphus CBS 101889]|uniref:Uncharacterized protein n=1 Tax=Aspergillus homomorphus (strain CBS 101889) TaxID=1450537 RepID=A0A395I3D6_ASPHC|nr:hypothetical protein BO97DRAFT_423478 [Aspergillus homomorphus CBS 101889]RAL13698.1 hypothetical protein BO97DRAFT_423478 [Aspergillus homomorphus CBS 101889]
MSVMEIIAFSWDNKRVAAGSRDGTFAVWNADNGELISTFRLDRRFQTLNVEYSLDSNKVIVTLLIRGARIFNLEKGRRLNKDEYDDDKSQTSQGPGTIRLERRANWISIIDNWVAFGG